jgi:hypothetical protein
VKWCTLLALKSEKEYLPVTLAVLSLRSKEIAPMLNALKI